MEIAQIDPSICGGESREYIDMPNIDEDFVTKLYAQKDRPRGGQRKLLPTERQKKILLDLWNRCDHRDVARAIGVSTSTALSWWRELQRAK